jgi:hypothetical protein
MPAARAGDNRLAKRAKPERKESGIVGVIGRSKVLLEKSTACTTITLLGLDTYAREYSLELASQSS